MTEWLNKPVVVLGGGGHASVLIDCLKRLGANILGITDPHKVKGQLVLGIKVLGSDNELESYSPREIGLANGLGITEISNGRSNLCRQMRVAGFSFVTVVDPTAIVLSEVHLGEGVQVLSRAVIQSRTKIGRDSIVNTGALIDHECLIGEDCHICPGVNMAGEVRVGTGTIIGIGTTVKERITIGENSIIGAASVIHKDLPSNVRFVQPRRENIKIRC